MKIEAEKLLTPLEVKLLSLFRQETLSCSLTEIAQKLGVKKCTAQYVRNSLIKKGILTIAEKSYGGTPSLLKLNR